MEKHIHATVELTNDGFSGYIEMNKAIISSEGETIQELKENLKDAFSLYVEDLAEKGADTKEYENIVIDVSLDVKALFDMLTPINVSGFASYSGMNRSLLGQYLSGQKTPSEKQSRKILENVQKLGAQLASIHYEH